MTVECVAILAILGIFTFSLARSGRRTTALALLPLLLVPLAFLAGMPLAATLASVTDIPRGTVRACVTLAGLVAACVLFGMLCGNFRSSRTRRLYLIMCGGFSAILTVILLFNLMTPLN